jgi:hypothetical protein
VESGEKPETSLLLKKVCCALSTLAVAAGGLIRRYVAQSQQRMFLLKPLFSADFSGFWCAYSMFWECPAISESSGGQK